MSAESISSGAIALSGRIAALYYSTPRFSAGRLRTEEGDEVAFAGPLMAREHDPVILHGAWEHHPKYGRQLRVTHFEFHEKITGEGLAHYLANHPDIKGIGPVKARRIAEAFGDDFDRVVVEEPQRIAEAARIPLELVQALREEWIRKRSLNASLTWLASFELTHHEMMKLIEKLGNSVVTVLSTDPFALLREIPGFGFRRLDTVAQKMGVGKNHQGRIRAGILHAVSERLDQGDCWVDHFELIELAHRLLALDALDSRDRIERELDALVTQGDLVCVSVSGRLLVAQPRLFRMERDIAARFAAGRENPHFSGKAALPSPDGLPPLNAAQVRALEAARRNSFVLVSGAGGTGKTRLIASIVKLYESQGLDVALAAPTGKAAKRLEEVVGMEAFTIHRLLGSNGREFTLDAENPIDADVVIVDEVSMVDVPLAWHLLEAIDPGRTCVVLVGDHNQLPPVGPGNILRDLIERRLIPTVILDQVVRQAGVLKENSLAVLRGQVHPTAPPAPDGHYPWVVGDGFDRAADVQEYICHLFQSILSERLGFDVLTDVQILAPMRKGPLGTDELNIVLQRLLQMKLWGVDAPATKPGWRPSLLPHDRVIQTRNNYELNVMNGAIGTVISVAGKGKKLVVLFENGELIQYPPESVKELSLAYALTIHKFQGAQIPCAIVVIHRSHAIMHTRNLFYTAVTRAQKTTIVVGDASSMTACANRAGVARRHTFLSVLDFEPAETRDT
jgi:exodeoxyribonuclease V alpha subunit